MINSAKNKILLFAYGSNMDHDQMINRGLLSAILVGVGKISNTVVWYPDVSDKRDNKGVLSIKKTGMEGDYILGLIYEIDEEEIQLMDKAEGIDHGKYKRVINFVTQIDNKKKLAAYVYVIDISSDKNYEPSIAYYSECLKAMIKNEFGVNYITRFITMTEQAKDKKDTNEAN